MSRKIRGQPKVLVVDDEPDLLELLELTLSRMGLDTTRAESVSDALRLLDREPFDLRASTMAKDCASLNTSLRRPWTCRLR